MRESKGEQNSEARTSQLHSHPLGGTGVTTQTLQQRASKRRKLPPHAPTSASLAHEYFAIDELARELKDKSKGYKTKPSPATARFLTPRLLERLRFFYFFRLFGEFGRFGRFGDPTTRVA